MYDFLAALMIFCPTFFFKDRFSSSWELFYPLFRHPLTAKEDTPTALLPQTHNRTVTQTLRKFSKEVKHRRSKQRDFKLTPAQKYILKELEKLFKDDAQEDLRSIVNELIRTVKFIHNPIILQELKNIKNNGFTAQPLLNKLINLYQQYDLKAQINFTPEPKSDLSISKIICSSALQGLGRN
jgi:hypothetical protein